MTDEQAIEFLSSTDLKHWIPMSRAGGFYECPDLFELPVDGNPANKKWVLTAANSDYQVGRFDGTRFTSETPRLTGQRGTDQVFYAAQSYSDVPDGRRIQIGWLRAPAPGMPFNQAMSLPLELRLVSTSAGPRLTRTPIAELRSLRAHSLHLGPVTVGPEDADPLARTGGELLEIRADFTPAAAIEIAFGARGIPIVYDTRTQELSVNGTHAPAPLRDGRQRLAIFVDRTMVEVFASDGLTYLPVAVIPATHNRSLELGVHGGAAKFATLDVYQLTPIWQ